jgi:MFS family permease
MPYQPADSLKNRTFFGLIIAQFLAGFNDQAIHASAMFYAIRQGILTEAQAISLMPILFYAPWAIFCTLAGHYADRCSKTRVLRIWKIAEVIISLVLLAGFCLGSIYGIQFGAWLVLTMVFAMGMHAAFFAPAKYGAMPEILQPHILSRGNGILESTTFLAAILGTVAGGYLSWFFRNQEYWIGVALLVLSVIGVAASYLIAYLPAANPTKPLRLFKPLYENLRVLLTSRPLALSVLGIAFFIFMVSYMRATMYMHGESRNPPWNELRTSLVVACVALGVGLGSPLAGYLSGGKIELGLVPLGCVGMIGAAVLAALMIDHDGGLVTALIIIGFFSGFYMVPLYTLLQHRAPKQSKGELIATSNFINVTGAIGASLLFFLLVSAVQALGITPAVEQTDNIAVGVLKDLKKDNHDHSHAEHSKKKHHGRPKEITIVQADGVEKTFRVIRKIAFRGDVPGFVEQVWEDLPGENEIEFGEDMLEVLPGGVREGDQVVVSKYQLGDVVRYRLRTGGDPLQPVYDERGLPQFLFLGAALMTLAILLALVRKLPDFFVRMLFWLRGLGHFRVKAVGMQNLPMDGPVILATNCDRLESSLQLVSATDRSTLFVLWENPERRETAPLLRALAQRTSLVEVARADHPAWLAAHARAKQALQHGDLLAVTVDGHADDEVESLLADLRQGSAAPIVPVYCGLLDGSVQPVKRVHVVFGAASRGDISLDDLRREIRQLGEWARQNGDAASAAH